MLTQSFTSYLRSCHPAEHRPKIVIRAAYGVLCRLPVFNACRLAESLVIGLPSRSIFTYDTMQSSAKTRDGLKACGGLKRVCKSCCNK